MTNHRVERRIRCSIAPRAIHLELRGDAQTSAASPSNSHYRLSSWKLTGQLGGEVSGVFLGRVGGPRSGCQVALNIGLGGLGIPCGAVVAGASLCFVLRAHTERTKANVIKVEQNRRQRAPDADINHAWLHKLRWWAGVFLSKHLQPGIRRRGQPHFAGPAIAR